GEIAIVFEHSFHSRCAVALTDNANRFTTDDRGKTWRFFDIPDPPTLDISP
ncbi:hypothetical protein BKA70DRAFT_1057360, partial [Coprinopsis sp. MPI-PUGE-AT-0042]